MIFSDLPAPMSCHATILDASNAMPHGSHNILCASKVVMSASLGTANGTAVPCSNLQKPLLLARLALQGCSVPGHLGFWVVVHAMRLNHSTCKAPAAVQADTALGASH